MRGSAFVWYKIVHMYVQHLSRPQVHSESVLFQGLQLSGQSFFWPNEHSSSKPIRFRCRLLHCNPRRLTSRKLQVKFGNDEIWNGYLHRAFIGLGYCNFVVLGYFLAKLLFSVAAQPLASTCVTVSVLLNLSPCYSELTDLEEIWHILAVGLAPSTQ